MRASSVRRLELTDPVEAEHLHVPGRAATSPLIPALYVSRSAPTLRIGMIADFVGSKLASRTSDSAADRVRAAAPSRLGRCDDAWPAPARALQLMSGSAGMDATLFATPEHRMTTTKTHRNSATPP